MKISRFEKIILVILVIALWAILAVYAGAPVFSDEFMYIDIGLRNYKEPSYGNRYFHIYLEKLFMSVAPTPLIGVRIFWGFVIALTIGLVYYNARTFLRGSNPLHGLLAAAFFLSFPMLVDYSGEPAVDLTAMLMVTLYLTVYLYGLHRPEKRKYALMALGTLAFLAFKTKETTIFINFLLLGYLFEEGVRWQWRRLLDLIKPLLIGLGIGILIFMLLDGFILGDPFFAIRPTTFGAIFTHYDFGKVFFDVPQNWYHEYFLDDLLLPFVLYLVSCLRLRDELDVPHKLVCVYPLLMAAFVTVNMVKIPWGIIERFYFPALPVVAMLAPQFLRFEWPKERRSWLGFGLLLAASGGLAFALRAMLLNFASSMSFDFSQALDSLYYPVILSILLASVVWIKKFNWAGAVIPLFCIAAMLVSPLMHNYKYIVRVQKLNERYATIMYPFRAFPDNLALAAGDRLYVSPRLDKEYGMLSDDPNDVVAMYNFYYDARISADNVFMGYTPDSLFKQLTAKKQTRALLTQADWELLQTDPAQLAAVKELYKVKLDLQRRVVLLVRK
jgi:4-amino-4-deoxy-L-arabinose transferase-like glycosyltransferase